MRRQQAKYSILFLIFSLSASFSFAVKMAGRHDEPAKPLRKIEPLPNKKSTSECELLENEMHRQCSESPRKNEDEQYLKNFLLEASEKKCFAAPPTNSFWKIAEWQKNRLEGNVGSDEIAHFLSSLSEFSKMKTPVFKEYTDSRLYNLHVKMNYLLGFGSERQFDTELAKLFEEAQLPVRFPLQVLENLCLNSKNVHPTYLQTGKIALASALLSIYIQQKESNFLKPENSAFLLKWMSKHDPQGFYRARFIENVLKPQSGHYGSFQRAHEDYTFIPTHAEDSQKPVNLFLHGLAVTAFNRLALEAKVPEYQASVAPLAVSLSNKIGPNDTYEFLIPSECETGDAGAALPSIGLLSSDKKKVEPFSDSEWFYEVTDKQGVKSQVHNGFYRREALKWDNKENMTRVAVKIPLEILNRKEESVSVGLQITCGGKQMLLAAKIPLVAEKRKELEDLIVPADAPPYAAFDADNVRRGLIAIGSNQQPIDESRLKFFSDLGLPCTKEGVVPYLDEFSKILSAKGEQSLDYFLKEAHANGYDHDSGVMRVYETATKWVCKGETSRGEGTLPLKQEIIILGYETKPDHYAQDITLKYDKFFKDIQDSTRKSPLLMANFSCSSTSKACMEMTHLKTPHIVMIPTTKAKYCHTPCNPDKDATYALVDGIVRNRNYSEMQQTQSVFNSEDILLPNHAKYKSSFVTGMSRILSRTPAVPLVLNTGVLPSAGREGSASSDPSEIKQYEAVLKSDASVDSKRKALLKMSQYAVQDPRYLFVLEEVFYGNNNELMRLAFQFARKAGKASIPMLLQALQGGNEERKLEAFRALASMEAPEKNQVIPEVLAAQDELSHTMQSDQANFLINKMRPVLLSHLAEQLKTSESPQQIRTIVQKIKELQLHELVPELLSLASQKSQFLDAVQQTLSGMSENVEIAMPHLLNWLNSEDSFGQAAAWETLVDIKKWDEKYIPEVLSHIQKDKKSFLANKLRVLNNILKTGNPLAEEVLSKMLEEKKQKMVEIHANPKTSWASMRELSTINELSEAVALLPEGNFKIKMLGQLKEMLNLCPTDHFVCRGEILEAFKGRDNEEIPMYFSIIDNPATSKNLRSYLLDSLGKVAERGGVDKHLPRIMELVSSKDEPENLMRFLVTLVKHPEKVSDILPVIEKRLQDPTTGKLEKASMKIAAALIPGSHSAEALKRVVEGFEGEDRGNMIAAVHQFGENIKPLLPIILESSVKHPELRSGAKQVLNEREYDVRKFLPLLSNPDPKVRHYGLSLIALRGDKAADLSSEVSRLMHHDPSPIVRQAAMETLDQVFGYAPKGWITAY